MNKILLIAEGDFVSGAFARRFPNCEVNVIAPHKLTTNAYEDKYNLVLVDVPSEVVTVIKEPLKIIHRIGTPVVVVTDAHLSKDALAEMEPLTIFVKPVDPEMVVSLAGAYLDHQRCGL